MEDHLGRQERVYVVSGVVLRKPYRDSAAYMLPSGTTTRDVILSVQSVVSKEKFYLLTKELARDEVDPREEFGTTRPE